MNTVSNGYDSNYISYEDQIYAKHFLSYEKTPLVRSMRPSSPLAKPSKS